MLNTTTEYLVLYGLIVGSLQANFLRHLVYKVMNLGILSIFVVALWAILTGPNFIYVVYVLAFVGAVIMLFLSVILMLPSSAIAPSGAQVVGLLSLSPTTGDEGTASSFFSFGGVLEALLSSAVLLVFCYLTLMLYYIGEKFESDRAEEPTVVISTRPGRNQPDSMVLNVPVYEKARIDAARKGVEFFPPLNAWKRVEGGDNKAARELGFLKYLASYRFFAFDCLESNDHMVSYCRNTSFIHSEGNCGSRFRAEKLNMVSTVDAMSPLYLVAEPFLRWESYTPGSLRVRNFLRVVYEFVDYYIRVIEPHFMTVDSSHFNLFVQLTYPARKLVGARH